MQKVRYSLSYSQQMKFPILESDKEMPHYIIIDHHHQKLSIIIYNSRE